MKDIKDLLKAITIQDGVAYVNVNAHKVNEYVEEPFMAEDLAMGVELCIRACITVAHDKIAKCMATSVHGTTIFFEDGTSYDSSLMARMMKFHDALIEFGTKEFSVDELALTFEPEELEFLLRAYVEGHDHWNHRTSELCRALCSCVYSRK